MRILVLTNQYPPHSLGGYALSCQAMVDELRRRGHRIYVLTCDARLPEVTGDGAGDGVHRDLHLWFRDLGRREPTLPRPPLRDRFKHERRNERTVQNVLATWRPDVVSVWEMGAMSLSTLTLVERAGVPMVLTLHDYWPQYAPQWDPWMRMFDGRPWARWPIAPLRMVTTAPELSGALANVVSRNLREKLSGEGRWRFPDAQVIHFGIDPGLFGVAEPVERRWDWKILYVGRLDVVKGIRTLALAMRHLPADASLEIIGQGDPGIAAMVKDIIGEPRATGRVRFSSCSRSELVGRYRAADALVFPSEWDEPFGLVPLEAMACGLPVVATGTGGSGEYLSGGENCLLFPPGDADRLAAAVRRLAEDEILRKKIATAGLVTAGRYSLERVADQMEDLHLAAVRRRSDPV
ncbi:MAG TPA: glycosyltransferase family 4 protein [Acidimicrobiales bacterium]|nr:glycosyltransferase family 4 protein [Acidimicrobiales bacterium]